MWVAPEKFCERFAPTKGPSSAENAGKSSARGEISDATSSGFGVCASGIEMSSLMGENRGGSSGS